MIASRVGIFAEDIEDGVQGSLVPPEDPAALARAITVAIASELSPTSTSPTSAWLDIGQATRDVYQQARARG